MFAKDSKLQEKGTELGGLIENWRQMPGRDETLSEDCRVRILAAMTEEGFGRSPGHPPLFRTTRMLAWAMALPALLLAAVMTWNLLPVSPSQEAGEAPQVSAIKRGNEVIFVIANGQRNHTVYRSETAAGLAGSQKPFALTDGTFRDRLDNGADLVFYRID